MSTPRICPFSLRGVALFTSLLHSQAQLSLKITNRCFRYAASHPWNKLPPSLHVPCQSATSECSLPSPGFAPKSVVGVSHRVFHSRFKTPFLQILSPVTFFSLSNGLISRFLSSTWTQVSGVENIGQCGRLSQISWLLGEL